MRGMPLIVVALFIDGFKALVYAACFSFGAGLATIPGVGVVSIPLGIGMGVALSFCISATLGSGLLLLLLANGQLYWKYAIGGGTAGILPLLDILPSWTVMTILCIVRTAKEEGALQGSAVSAFGSLLIPNAAKFSKIQDTNQARVTRMIQTGYAKSEKVGATQTKSEQHVATNLKEIDGIRVRSSKRSLASDRPTMAGDYSHA